MVDSVFAKFPKFIHLSNDSDDSIYFFRYESLNYRVQWQVRCRESQQDGYICYFEIDDSQDRVCISNPTGKLFARLLQLTQLKQLDVEIRIPDIDNVQKQLLEQWDEAYASP